LTTCSWRTQVVSAPDDYYVEVPAAFIQLKPGATVTEEGIIDFCAGKIATFRVPRYVRFVTEWPMSGTKIKKAILREMIAADLKEKGITRAPQRPVPWRRLPRWVLPRSLPVSARRWRWCGPGWVT
jgi:fatty-acyl-CoA synthase